MSAYAMPGLFPPLGSTTACTFSTNTLGFDMGSLLAEEKIEFEVVARVPARRISVLVKDARVDPARYIHSLVKKENSTRGRLRRRNSEPIDLLASCSREGESMLFELSVRHSNKATTGVVRSLARLQKLRADLTRELSSRRLNSPTFLTQQQQDIPLLPCLPDDCKSLSFVLMKDVLRSYAPCLQEWFETVLSSFPCVEDSKSLADFLYESPGSMPCAEKMWRHHSLPAKLDAIEESEDEDSEDDFSL